MSDKTRIRRLPERGTKSREVIDAILDEGLVCHAAYLVEERPVVIPTLYVRHDDRILLHGSNSSGLASAVRRGSPLSIAVTLIDGLVVARSGLNSSANYRSVVIHGYGRILPGSEKQEALDIIVEGLIPGRVADIRPPSESEVRQTAVIAVELTEASAKVRAGGPHDEPADLESDAWAGVVPLRLTAETAQPSSDLEPSIPLPDYLDPYSR